MSEVLTTSRVASAAILLLLPWWCAASDRHVEGASEYQAHCAVCHGVEGRGDGPMADKLIRRPNDLTLLSQRNGGSFPETFVYQVVDGRRIVLFHGTSEMPVWGNALRGNNGEGGVDARISALVSHIESIQHR